MRWSDDVKTFVTNALAPAKITRMTLDEVARAVTVIVDPDQLSLAIGKKGQNARLTAKLTGWKIDIQEDETAINFEKRVAMAVAELAKVPGISPDFSTKLVHAGFLTLDGILAAELDDLTAIEGITEDDAKAIRTAAEVASTPGPESAT